MPVLQKMLFSGSAEIRSFRKKIRMTQAEFWERIGITQSGGCRYETGREIPMTIQLLLQLAYAPDAKAQKTVDALRAWKPRGSMVQVGEELDSMDQTVSEQATA